ncbi:unnamed protein product [Citrullus colocynthis]|uniref:Cytochrome P450 n=1 Tax=Citrullus colocynthis TaxID=252529 RepID=A0ABP0XSC3_9ROSI
MSMSISAPFFFLSTSFWPVHSNQLDKQISISILLVALTFALFWLRPKKVRRPCLPPGPHGLPLVGYLPFLSGNPHHKLTHLSEIYGPVFKLRLGTKLCVVLNSPASINEAFATRKLSYQTESPPFVLVSPPTAVPALSSPRTTAIGRS